MFQKKKKIILKEIPIDATYFHLQFIIIAQSLGNPDLKSIELAEQIRMLLSVKISFIKNIWFFLLESCSDWYSLCFLNYDLKHLVL